MHWFPVRQILGAELEDASDIFQYVYASGLNFARQPFQKLARLHKVVHDTPVINFHEESAPELDKVLDIFSRVNSGTVLSRSDLLLSVATAQWSTRDARSEIHGFVDQLNRVGQGFAFDKDVVLKAGLLLTEVSDVGLKVSSFNRANMVGLEQEWDNIGSSLRLAAGLLADFGFSATNLPATSVLIPVAYYLHHRGVGEAYRVSDHARQDRERLDDWVIRDHPEPGVWVGSHTLLDRLRAVLAQEGANEFPVTAVETAMALCGKALRFTAEEIEELVMTPYGDRHAFPLLALLFPHVNTRNPFHVDHVFPRSVLRRARLENAGIDPSRFSDWFEMADALPNLQLLEGILNVEKQDQLPVHWLVKNYPDEVSRDHYQQLHALGELPPELRGFASFFVHRRYRLRERLVDLLGEPGQCARISPLTIERTRKTKITCRRAKLQNRASLRIVRQTHSRSMETCSRSRGSDRVPYRLDAVFRAADARGFGAEFRALCNVAEELGLHVRPYTDCVMFTPPQNRTFMAVTVCCRPRKDHGKIGFGLATDNLREFFGISEQSIVQAMGRKGWWEIERSEVSQVIEGLKALFGSVRPRLTCGAGASEKQDPRKARESFCVCYSRAEHGQYLAIGDRQYLARADAPLISVGIQVATQPVTSFVGRGAPRRVRNVSSSSCPYSGSRVTDSASYSDVVFGLFMLLGYRFSPRLADLGGTRFFRISSSANCGPLNRLARHRINTNLITRNWDDLLRSRERWLRSIRRASLLTTRVERRDQTRRDAQGDGRGTASAGNLQGVKLMQVNADRRSTRQHLCPATRAAFRTETPVRCPARTWSQFPASTRPTGPASDLISLVFERPDGGHHRNVKGASDMAGR